MPYHTHHLNDAVLFRARMMPTDHLNHGYTTTKNTTTEKGPALPPSDDLTRILGALRKFALTSPRTPPVEDNEKANLQKLYK